MACSRRPGFPIRAPADHGLFAGSPRLFAGSCALRRLLPPRHPPYALIRLAIQPQPARPGRTRRVRLRVFRFLHFASARRPPPPRGRPAARAFFAHPNCKRIRRAVRPAAASRRPASPPPRGGLAARRNRPWHTRKQKNKTGYPEARPAASPRQSLVEPGRIELPTSCVQGRRSPS